MAEPPAEGTLADVFAFFASDKKNKPPLARLFGHVPKLGDTSQLQGRVTNMSGVQTGLKGTVWVDFTVRAFLGDGAGYHNFRCIAYGALARAAHLVFPHNATVVVWGTWTVTRRQEAPGGPKVARKTLQVRRGYDLKTRRPDDCG